MKCKYCKTKMKKINLKMTTYKGPYNYAFICPNNCAAKNKDERR